MRLLRKICSWMLIFLGLFYLFMYYGLNSELNEHYRERQSNKYEGEISKQTFARLEVPVRKSIKSYIERDVNNSMYDTTIKDDYTFLNEFYSLDDAHRYMSLMTEIVPKKIVINYSNFSQKLPHFIDESDEELFLKSPGNRENLLPPKKEQLLGIIEIVENGTFMSREFDCGYRANYNFVKEIRKPTVGKSYDILAPIIVPESYAFQHFYDGTLPKIIQALPLLQKPGVKLIIQTPGHKNINLILEKLGFGIDKLILHPKMDQHSVYYAKYMIMTCIAPPLHPLLWRKAKDDVLHVPKSLPLPKEENIIMLLTRAGAVNSGRKMINEKQVITFLKNRYGDQLVVFNGAFSLNEAIRIFSRVRIIIGVHGGAFYNMNFAPYDTRVIEIGPVTSSGGDIPRLPHTIFWAMAEMLGQEYWRIQAIASKYMDVEVDVQKLEAILNTIDKEDKL